MSARVPPNRPFPASVESPVMRSNRFSLRTAVKSALVLLPCALALLTGSRADAQIGGGLFPITPEQADALKRECESYNTPRTVSVTGPASGKSGSIAVISPAMSSGSGAWKPALIFTSAPSRNTSPSTHLMPPERGSPALR